MSGHVYFDLDGKPIGLMEWAALREDFAARTVAESTVGKLTVRTMWLGLVLPDTCPPLFGTAIFGSDGHTIAEVTQWDTKEQALAGHPKIVAVLETGVARNLAYSRLLRELRTFVEATEEL